MFIIKLLYKLIQQILLHLIDLDRSSLWIEITDSLMILCSSCFIESLPEILM
jgi:hypothetical protein